MFDYSLKKHLLYLFLKRNIIRLPSTQNFINFSSKSPITVNLVHKEVSISKFQNLFGTNEAKKESIEIILKQYEYLKYVSGHVPSDITIPQMYDLMAINNEYQRKKYLRYLFITEVRKLKDNIKKAKKKSENQAYFENCDQKPFGIFDHNGQLSYQLWGNSLISRISSKNISHIRTTRNLRFASLFGQKLIIDLDYDDFMNLNECRIQVRHIVELLIQNLHRNEPFDIYFTNCDYQKPTMKYITKYYNSIPFQMTLLKDRFLSDNYLDVFPKERLVYLSPNAREAIQTYNHEDIYIIGGFLDKSSLNKPISHLKASTQGIRQYRLPLDENVIWNSGSSKHLCIIHMVAILNQVKNTGDWRQSLKDNIPKRKIKSPELLKIEEKQRRTAYIKRKLQSQNYFD